MSAVPRVVSLVPSITETLLAWGITPVACTRFCEQPGLTHVGGTKDPNIAAIVDLAPDVVVMDREENRREDADALTQRGIDVYATHVRAVDDVPRFAARLRERLGLSPEVADGDDDAAVAPSVEPLAAFVAIWRRPWMTLNAQTYASSLLETVGVANVYANDDVTYPTVTLDDVVRRAPRLVLLPSEPYPFKPRHAAEIAEVLPETQIHFVDGRDLFWWGVRTEAARRRLGQVLRAS